MEFNKYFLRNHSRGHEGEQDGDPAKNGIETYSGKRALAVLRILMRKVPTKCYEAFHEEDRIPARL